MTTSIETSPPAVEYSTQASQLGRVPTTLTMKDGTLALSSERLRYETRKGVVFDHPVSEFHSVAASSKVGLHVWHGSRCYKFVPGHEIVLPFPNDGLVGLAINAGRIGSALAADQRMQETRDRWIELLAPLVGEPPAGVDVRKPWPTWAIMTASTCSALLLMAVIAVGTWLFSS